MTEGPQDPVAEVSHSRLDKYESCPSAFWHAYVARTPPDGYERAEAWTGSLVHQVLEEALKATRDRKVPSRESILARYEELWNTTAGPHVLVVRDGKRLDDYRANGRKWLLDYIAEEWPFVRDSEPIHVEEEFTFPVVLPKGDEITFRGVLDRVDRLRDGRLRLIDYKTGSFVPDFRDPEEARQLALYWRGLSIKYPDAPGGELVWHYLQARHRAVVKPDEALVNGAISWLARTAQEIRDRLEAPGPVEARFPPRPSALCRWCEFGYTCAANPFRTSAPKRREGAAEAPIAPSATPGA